MASTISAEVGGLLTLTWAGAAGAVVACAPPPGAAVGCGALVVGFAAAAGADVGCAGAGVGGGVLAPELHAERNSAVAIIAVEYI
jgi:hypothetical protein